METLVDTVQVGPRRYLRVNVQPPRGAKQVGSALANSQLPPRTDLPPGDEDDDDDETYAVTHDDDRGEFVGRLHVAEVFFGTIIGKGGRQLKELQAETSTRIAVPGKKHKKWRKGSQEEEKDVVVRGKSRRDVVSAMTRMELLIDSTIPKLPYTHFVCFPLNTEEVVGQGRALQAEVAEACAEVDGFHTSIFMPVEKTHLTLLMLKLYTEEMVQQAVEVMRNLSATLYDALGTTTLLLDVSRLGTFGQNTSRANVVFVEVQPDSGLDKAKAVAALTIKALNDADLLPDDEIDKQPLLVDGADVASLTGADVNIKWHCTLLNTKYRKQDNAGDGSKNKKNKNKRFPKRVPLDAEPILDQFGAAGYGKVRVPSLTLASLHGVREDGFYVTPCNVSFP